MGENPTGELIDGVVTHRVVRHGMEMNVRVRVGTRFYVWGETRTVEELKDGPPYEGWDAGVVYARLSAKPRGLDGRPKAHWTDWMPSRNLCVHGELLEEGEERDSVARRSRAEVIEDAAEKAREASRKTKPLTPQRRIQNRITTLRHKLRNPTKHGRSEWNPSELREIEAEIAAAEAERDALKAAAKPAKKPAKAKARRRPAAKKELS